MVAEEMQKRIFTQSVKLQNNRENYQEVPPFAGGTIS